MRAAFTLAGRQIAKSVLEGRHDALLACRERSDIREQLPPVADEVMDVFDAVASETDVMPLGSQRAHWTTESLTVKDAEAGPHAGVPLRPSLRTRGQTTPSDS